MAETLGIDVRTQGVVVHYVGDDTPAERAGVRPMDVITHFGGQLVSSPSELQRAVERAPLDSRQTLRVMREGSERSLSVRTEALPDTSAARGSRPRNDAAEDRDEALHGMSVTDLSGELARRLRIEGEEGVLVTGVSPNSIAAESGIRRGLLVREVDGKVVETAAEFARAIESGSVDRGIKLTVRVPKQGTQLIILKRR